MGGKTTEAGLIALWTPAVRENARVYLYETLQVCYSVKYVPLIR